ncbi:MAG: sulfite exporter TauE/SafE family protein [Kangiellaceae bacterium]|nr:sulfite exporter TauE/SafE family protein [Kangiellaceae bacterium]
MIEQSQYLVAFLTGLFGGVHCFGMCGGIVGALTLGTSKEKKTSPLIINLGYNIGRISGYIVAGALVGFLGSSLVDLTGIQTARQVLAVIASLFMIALGLYLAGIWNGIAKIESLGTVLWKRIQPLTQRFIPVKSFQQALPLGFLWGWLPCGLVYTALIWTLSAGGAIEGALIMLAFGLGTLPNLLAMGVMAARLSKWVRHPKVRLIAGMLVVLMGVLTLFRSF